ncbi:hypothetical protein, partial [Streptomyces sanglieri]|uniref:hypothetical protein n=1 Tax=Streptomyces sanglieri TaxID=193460 RepID=UPI003525A325
ATGGVRTRDAAGVPAGRVVRTCGPHCDKRPRRTAARTWASGGNHPYGSVRSAGEIPLRPGAGAVIYVVSDDVTVLENT